MTTRTRSAPPNAPLTLVPLPPSMAIDSERAVIGALLLNRDAVWPMLEFPAEAFSLASHQQLFSAIVALARQGIPPDLRTVQAELERRAELEAVGGVRYLMDLLDAAPTSYHITYYADSVRQAAYRRGVADFASTLAAAASDPGVSLTALAGVLAGQGGHALGRFTGSTYAPALESLADLRAKTFAPIQWAIPGIIPEGLTLLAGKPKLGKSWLILDAALALASGQPAFGSITLPDRWRVMYLGLEDSERRLHERAELLLSEDSDAPFYWTTRWPTLDAGGLDMIASYLHHHEDTKMVVIDTLAKVMPPQGKQQSLYDYEYQALAGLQRLANDHHISIVCVTHTRKMDASDALDTVSGSTGKTAAADNILVLTRVRGEDLGELDVVLRDAPSQKLAVAFDPAQSRWTITGDARSVAISSTRAQIIEFCQTDRLYPRDLARLMPDQREASLRRLLRQMVDAKQLLQDDNGRYAALIEADHPDHPDQGRSPRSPDHPGTWRTPIGYDAEGGDA